MTRQIFQIFLLALVTSIFQASHCRTPHHDSALIIVDCAEGDCILKLSREELYQRFNKLVESVNVLLETFREEALYTGPLDELATAICNCDPNGP